MTYAGPVLLTSEHVITGFDCDKSTLNDWLTKRALANQETGATRTWVVIDEESGRENPVVGFYASCTGAVLREQAPKFMARNQPEQIPALVLARLAVDTKHRGNGLGAALLKHFMSIALQVNERVGVRLLLVHAKDEEASSFYSHYGFEASPIDDLVLMMLLPGNRR